MKKISLTLLLVSFCFSLKAQQFSFSNEDGVVFEFNLTRENSKLILEITMDNLSKNVCLFADSSGEYSFLQKSDSSAFLGIGFDYSIFPYSNDFMIRKFRVFRVLPLKKHSQILICDKEGSEQIKTLKIGFDYFTSNKEIEFNENTKREIIKNHKYFNFTIPLSKKL